MPIFKITSFSSYPNFAQVLRAEAKAQGKSISYIIRKACIAYYSENGLRRSLWNQLREKEKERS